MFKSLATAFFLLFTVPTFAVEYAWVSLVPHISYSDFELGCANYYPTVLFSLGVEMDKGAVTKATLRIDPKNPKSEGLALDADETKAVQYAQDSQGRRWLKSIPATPKIVEWILFHSSHASSPCVPPQKLKSVTANAKSFQFYLNLVGVGLSQSTSQILEVSGKNVVENDYTARIKLEQDPF